MTSLREDRSNFTAPRSARLVPRLRLEPYLSTTWIYCFIILLRNRLWKSWFPLRVPLPHSLRHEIHRPMTLIGLNNGSLTTTAEDNSLVYESLQGILESNALQECGSWQLLYAISACCEEIYTRDSGGYVSSENTFPTQGWYLRSSDRTFHDIMKFIAFRYSWNQVLHFLF